MIKETDKNVAKKIIPGGQGTGKRLTFMDFWNLVLIRTIPRAFLEDRGEMKK